MPTFLNKMGKGHLTFHLPLGNGRWVDTQIPFFVEPDNKRSYTP